jgi:short-subunit dehydrogenase
MVAEQKKVVLLTGASAGIGASVARELARQGFNLALTARREDRLRQLADELVILAGTNSRIETGQAPIDVLVVPTPLEDPSAPERLISATIRRFGRLDVLINNAGFGLPTLFADADPTDVRRQLEVNFVAPLMLSRHAIPHLLERRGTIINVGSAISCLANSALGAYGATKAGLAYWNDALRRELQHRGVTVCLVEPGPVKTEFFSALEKLAPENGEYNPLLDAPAPWMSAQVDEVARRIVRLIEHPRRRLSVPRRFVWPWRALGGLFRVWPWLGDLGLSTMTKHFDKKGDLNRTPSRSLGNARPTE